MKIRLGRREDVNTVNELYEAAKEGFRMQGIDQWQQGYPNRETYLEDLEKNLLYVWEDDEIVMTGVLMTDPEPTYEKIYEGTWKHDEPYGTIHRFTVSPSMRGRRLGVRGFKDLEAKARELGLKTMRIDTHRDNLPMQKTILNSGYQYAGIIYLPDGAPRLAYEKNLEG